MGVVWDIFRGGQQFHMSPQDFLKPSLRDTLLFFVVALRLSVRDVAAEPLVVWHNFFKNANAEALNYKGEVLALILEKSKAKYGPYVRKKKSVQQDWSQPQSYSIGSAGQQYPAVMHCL
jgi:hypothetical protein